MPAPDDLYKSDVDFTALALQYPDFAKRLKSNRQLDFSDPESVRQLTKALLHRDFDLSIDLPDNRLCPPVPNRFNYIVFIQRLLDSTTTTTTATPYFHPFGHDDGYDPDRQVIGLDIGTGSSAIYPLLACRQRPKWLFLATEIDDTNRNYALKNIAANNLQSRIKLIDTEMSGQQLIPSTELARLQVERIDILMTNPPFYESESSMLSSARSKSRPANSSCTGAPIEMITPGGEVSFVSRLIDESALPQNRARIQWSSAMLGKLSSVGSIVQHLRDQKCTNFAVTDFIQGSGKKTRRWCVAWSWLGSRPSMAVSRGTGTGTGIVGSGSGVEKKYLPSPTEMEFDMPMPITPGGMKGAMKGLAVAEKRVNEEIGKLLAGTQGVLWTYAPARRAGMLMSKEGDVWSRKARRKKLHHQEEDQEMKDHSDEPSTADAEDSNDDKDQQDPEPEPEPALVLRIDLSEYGPSNGHETKRTRIHLRHLQGHDPVLFESFCGWLKRKVS
jgi:23S rRNA (adenine1618-N6)-methyltransferase